MKQFILLILMSALLLGRAYGQCSTPFFSEYLEGTSNNKAIEIYNPGNAAINLSNYQVHRYNNGGTTSPVIFQPRGILAPAGVYTIANAAASAAVTAVADTLDAITNYNGDDVLMLIDVLNSDTLDIIGVFGQDPGVNWPVGTGATSEFTLVRADTVRQGTTDWTLSATQWVVYPQNTFIYLSNHSMLPCGPATTPTISFQASNYSFTEQNGVFFFNVQLNLSVPDTFAVEVRLAAGGSATPLSDFTWNDTTIVFPQNTSLPITLRFGLVDDAISEGPEQFSLVLANPTNGAVLGADDTLVVNILDNDQLPSLLPYYPIARVTTNDGQGVADSIRVSCELRGIVYGVDMRGGTGLQFTLIDYSGGIGVFSTPKEFGYVVNEGDSLHIQGLITQFNGLTQIEPDTLVLISQNNPLRTPLVVNNLDESTESELVRINGLRLVNPAQWPALGANANVTVNDGTNTFTMRIDADTDIDGSPAPTGVFDLIGLGGQFDSFSPFTAGYQILPRYLADILPVAPSGLAFVPTAISQVEGNATVNFTVALGTPQTTPVGVTVELDVAASSASLGADFAWSDTTLTFPANSSSPVSLSLQILDDAILEGNERIVLKLRRPTGNSSLTDSVLNINIVDNELPVYPIGLVTADANNDGLGDSLTVRCELRGIVHGVNIRGAVGLQFTIIDSTGGIGTFSGTRTFGYTVKEGDDVAIRGQLGHFNGLTQMNLDTVIFYSANNPLQVPRVVSDLDESAESELVRIECWKLVNPSQWTNTGSGFNVDVTNNQNTVQVRIDRDVDLFGQPAPQGWLNITGIGGQFDNSAPHLSGYQLFPRYQADIVRLPDPSVNFDQARDTVREGATPSIFNIGMTLDNGNPDTTTLDIRAIGGTATLGNDFSFAGPLQFQFAGKLPQQISLLIDIIDDMVSEGDESIELEVRLQNGAYSQLDTMVLVIRDNDPSRLGGLLDADAISLSPNPARERLNLRSALRMEQVEILTPGGQLLQQLTHNGNSLSLNVDKLPAGLYFVRVQTPSGLWIRSWAKL